MLLLWFCFDRELELEWLIFLSIYDDFLGFFCLKKFNLLYFCRQCWKCWTKSGAGKDKPPDREWLCFEMVGDFSSFLKLTPSKHFLWPTHIRRKPNHCKTHYLYCSCPQILVTYMFICASKIWGPGPKPVLFRSQKPVFEAPECWTGSPLVQPTRDSMCALLSLSSKFSTKTVTKKNCLEFLGTLWQEVLVRNLSQRMGRFYPMKLTQ